MCVLWETDSTSVLKKPNSPVCTGGAMEWMEKSNIVVGMKTKNVFVPMKTGQKVYVCVFSLTWKQNKECATESEIK